MHRPALSVCLRRKRSRRRRQRFFTRSFPDWKQKDKREKAFHDILLSVKTNSYQFYTERLGSDVDALKQVIEGKKALEELAKTHISLD